MGRDGNDAMSWSLILVVDGTTSMSRRALSNLRQICEARIAGRYSLEVIDIAEDPEAAQREGIMAVPTLIRAQPLPRKKIIGDLSARSKVLSGLGLEADL